jgi:N-acetylglutamate synthase-like GNAT family acetyltransferase
VEGFSITNNVEEMDTDVIYSFLNESYWAKGIPLHIVKTALANSLCFGILDTRQNLVGFGRLVTDKATIAYLADVFVLPSFRGIGLSKWLMECIIKHPELQGLRRIMLATSDASELYSKFGFCKLVQPEIFMEIWNPSVYEQV